MCILALTTRYWNRLLPVGRCIRTSRLLRFCVQLCLVLASEGHAEAGCKPQIHQDSFLLPASCSPSKLPPASLVCRQTTQELADTQLQRVGCEPSTMWFCFLAAQVTHQDARGSPKRASAPLGFGFNKTRLPPTLIFT